MDYQQIINAIRNAANAVNPTGTFIHGRNSDAANRPDAPYPRIHLYPFTQDRQPNDLERRSSSILMAFVKADTGDNDVNEREAIIAEMDALCNAFIDELIEENSDAVQFDSVRTEPQYNVLEGVSGFSLSINMVTVAGC